MTNSRNSDFRDGQRKRSNVAGSVTLLALTAGGTISTIYYVQPLRSLIAAEFDFPISAAAAFPSSAQFGYAVGLLAIVPLSDSYDRRRVVIVQTAGLMIALLAVTLAPTWHLLTIAFAAVGIGAAVAQQMVPFAASLAAKDVRAPAVGRVVAGILFGFAFAWILSASIAALAGWRAVFIFAAGCCAVLLSSLVARLPSGPAPIAKRYRALLLSMLKLILTQRNLRQSAAIQTLIFTSFIIFWNIGALSLRDPSIGLSIFEIGVFGLLSMVSPISAIISGRLTREGYDWMLVLVGGLLCGMGFLISGFAPTSLYAFIATALAVSVGMPLALIPNQLRAVTAEPAAHSRLNAIFIALSLRSGALVL